MNTGHSPFILLALTGLLALQGCGDANDSTKGDGGTIKNPPNPNKPVVEVLIQGTAAMADPELGALAVKNIRVYSVDHEGLPAGNYFQASDYSYKIQDNGSYVITFNRPYSLRADLVIAVELETDEVMRRMLPGTPRNTDDKPHPINPTTEYAMQAFFDQVDENEFEQMKPCPQDTLLCERQPEVHALNLAALLEAVADFEIDFDPSMDLDQTQDSLDENVAFHRLVRQSVNSLKQKKIVGIGTDLIDPNVALDRYNTVAFSLELNQGNPSDVTLGGITATPGSSQTAVFSHWVSSETVTGEARIPYYPYASLATVGLAYISGFFTGDTPQQRGSLTLQADGFQPQPITSTTKYSVLGIGNIFTFLNTQGFHEFSTLQSQSVTGVNLTSPEQNAPIGWHSNPYFASLYDAKAQSSLLDSRAFNGYVLDLGGTGPFVRENILEQTHTFQFIAYSLQSDQPGETSTSFNPEVVLSKQYGVIALTQKFNDTDSLLKASSGLYLWQGSSSTSSLSESQPGASLFNTQTIGRTTAGAPFAPVPETPAATPRERQLESIPNLVYNNQYPLGENYYTGRLELKIDSNVPWRGMSDPGGKLLTFNLNSTTDGQGIVQGVQLTTATMTSLAGEHYRLEGNGFGITDTENFLFHVDESDLTFNEDGTATLAMNQLRVTQNVASNEVSTFQEKPVGDNGIHTCTTTPTFPDSTYTNVIRLDFSATDCPGFGIVLEGFIAEPDATNSDDGGRLMILRMRQDNSIGLLYGMRQKNLTPIMYAQ